MNRSLLRLSNPKRISIPLAGAVSLSPLSLRRATSSPSVVLSPPTPLELLYSLLLSVSNHRSRNGSLLNRETLRCLGCFHWIVLPIRHWRFRFWVLCIFCIQG